jgi:hypothetical protein
MGLQKYTSLASTVVTWVQAGQEMATTSERGPPDKRNEKMNEHASTIKAWIRIERGNDCFQLPLELASLCERFTSSEAHLIEEKGESRIEKKISLLRGSDKRDLGRGGNEENRSILSTVSALCFYQHAYCSDSFLKE